MKTVRTLGLAAVIGLAAMEVASAAPMSIASGPALQPVVGTAAPVIEKVVIVCGPYRCWRRPPYWGPRWGYWHRPYWRRYWW